MAKALATPHAAMRWRVVFGIAGISWIVAPKRRERRIIAMRSCAPLRRRRRREFQRGRRWRLPACPVALCIGGARSMRVMACADWWMKAAHARRVRCVRRARRGGGGGVGAVAARGGAMGVGISASSAGRITTELLAKGRIARRSAEERGTVGQYRQAFQAGLGAPSARKGGEGQPVRHPPALAQTQRQN